MGVLFTKKSPWPWNNLLYQPFCNLKKCYQIRKLKKNLYLCQYPTAFYTFDCYFRICDYCAASRYANVFNLFLFYNILRLLYWPTREVEIKFVLTKRARYCPWLATWDHWSVWSLFGHYTPVFIRFVFNILAIPFFYIASLWLTSFSTSLKIKQLNFSFYVLIYVSFRYCLLCTWI